LNDFISGLKLISVAAVHRSRLAHRVIRRDATFCPLLGAKRTLVGTGAEWIGRE
jgi:hypothetical protein